MNHYLYQINNLINGKWYRGKRSCKCDIKDDKYMGSGVLIKKAINVYGINNFEKIILCVCDSDEDAYELEELIITQDDIENTMCYNLVLGGYGYKSGRIRPKEEVLKSTASNIGRKRTDEQRQRMANSRKGFKHTEESKLKISEKGKGRITSDHTKSKLSQLRKGYKHSAEAKLNMSKAQTGRKLSDEAKLKMSKAKLGKENPKKFRSISMYSLDDILIKTYESIKYAVDDGYGRSGIMKCLSGERLSHKKHKWKYN